MAEVVFKYPLEEKMVTISDGLFSTEIVMPTGVNPLHIGMQHGIITMWARVDPNNKEFSVRKFLVAGTGREFNDELNLEYIGTVDSRTGLIWHVFEVLG